MNEVRFYLNLSADEYLKFYRGVAQSVVVRAQDGRRIQFPAEHLRSFVTEAGIQGHFALRFNRQNKLIAIERVRPGR